MEHEKIFEIPRVAEAGSAALGGVDLPDFLTVEEAARVLRLGRTSAYALAAQFEETGAGLPVVRFGRLLRVPRAQLEVINGGPLTSIPRSRPARPVDPAPSSAPSTEPGDSQQLPFPSTAA